MTDDALAILRLADDGCPNEGRRRLDYAEAEALVLAHEPFAKALARQWRRAAPFLDRDDLLACILGGFWEAACRFEPSRGLAFDTFAVWRARHWVKELSHFTRSRGLGTPWRDPGRVRAENFAGGSERFVPARAGEELPEFPADFWERAQALGGREAQVVLWRYRDGLTLRECGERLGITKEGARRVQNRALEKLGASDLMADV